MNIAKVGDCEGCYRVKRVDDGESEAWCFGFRRNATERPCDVVQWCRIPADKPLCPQQMLTLDEAACIASGFAEVIRVATRPLRVNCRRRKCSEWTECSNGGGG